MLLPFVAAAMLWGHYWDASNCMTIPTVVAKPEYRGTASGFAYMFVKLPSFLAIFLFPSLFTAVGQAGATLFVAIFPLVGPALGHLHPAGGLRLRQRSIAMPPRVACIGECMIELQELPSGLLQRRWGGDTLNTAVYLARLGVSVDYVTALGDDGWSCEMVAAWRDEGVGTGLVHHLPGRLPGLYLIQTDPGGERRFHYWRDSSAVRHLLDHLDIAVLDAYDVLYLSGITLSIFDPAARDMLQDRLAAARARGAQVVFDTNFRARLWPDRDVARHAYGALFATASTILASTEDLASLFGDAGEAELLQHVAETEIVLKLDRPGSRLHGRGVVETVQADPVGGAVIDTTAAGDSFAAAYVAARLRGRPPAVAARAGHTLAGVVVQHPGAIIPRGAMPHAADLLEHP